MLSLPKFTRNAFDFSHGGALSTYVDIATTCALFGFDKRERTHVSANLNMEFLSAGKTGEFPDSPSYFIDSKVIRIGKNLAFTEGIIIDEKSM